MLLGYQIQRAFFESAFSTVVASPVRSLTSLTTAARIQQLIRKKTVLASHRPGANTECPRNSS